MPAGERLRPGASNPGLDDAARRYFEHEEHQRRAAEHADAMRRGRWWSEDGWSVDVHPHDAAPAPPAPEPHAMPSDTAGRLAEARDRHANGSPMVLTRVRCVECGRVGTYYGRHDALPAEHTCRRCADQ